MDHLPLSLLNDYLYCERRAALKTVEGVRSANAHTAKGDIVHEHADLQGYEVAKGVTLLRALPVWSDRLGLNGKCDIVEQRANGSLFPVEYKSGKRRQWDNDDVQLCAQALCLEEMFGYVIPAGAVFHADSKRRREVPFTHELRALALQTIAALHELAAGSRVPPAVFKPACEHCSLFDICLPRATSDTKRAARMSARLFEAS
jgi:CRISPR-associated exonuclease Cas4